MKRYGDLISDGGSNILEQVAAQRERSKRGLAGVDHVMAVMSGKGGVGKTSITVNIAAALAMSGWRVGIMDADVNGACVARMTGVAGQTPSTSESGVVPIRTGRDVSVMGIDLLMEDDSAPVLWDAPTQKDAYTWRSMMEVAAVREFVSDTAWGKLDALFVDLPPGADRLPNLLDVLPSFSGAIVVTLPTAVSQLVVKRSVRMATEVLFTEILGLVENMSERRCPHCGEIDPLFRGGKTETMATDLGIPFLGSVPFDPRLARTADRGSDFLKEYADSDAANAFIRLAERVRDSLESRTNRALDQPDT